MSTSDPPFVNIQTSAEPLPSVPAWFGEVALVAHTMTRLGLLSNISEQVRFARKRFGTYEVIDFVVLLIGYGLSSARCLRVLICHHRRGVCLRSVRLGTRDRNAERWCVPVRRSCKRIPIAGWQVLGEQAMGITEESCCGDLRSSLRTRLRWVCSPLRPSFVLMDCMATWPSWWI